MTTGTTLGQEKSLQEDDTEAEKEVATKSGRELCRQGEKQVNRSPWGLDCNESHTEGQHSEGTV